MEKIKIWGDQIPYNSSRSKLCDMKIDYKKKQVIPAMVRFLFAGIRGKEFKDRREAIDTFSYLAEIKPGLEKETYEDTPYITPFLVPGSKRAVLVVPGGGFTYKQSDLDGVGKQAEGDMVAKFLNEAGISAFVLWYRTNPYAFPVPLVDMQRAVRFLRYNADAYGIDPDKISAIGFSAGGYEIAGLMNILHGENRFPADYQPDEIDAVSDKLETAGLIYPCVSFKCLIPMMNACFPYSELDTPSKVQAKYDEYSCIENFCATDTPQFLCYGAKDMAIPSEHTEEYVAELKENRVDHEILYLPHANHGFGANPVITKLLRCAHWIPTYLNWYDKHTV